MQIGVYRQTANEIMQRQTSHQKEVISLIILCAYFVISIFEPYINGIIGSITKYYIFVIMIVLLLQHRGRLSTTRSTIAMIIWILYKFFSLLWSRDYTTPTMHYISQIGMLLFLIVLFSCEYGENIFEGIEITYWISSGIIGLLSLFFSHSYINQIAARQVLIVAGVETDPNNQAALLLVGICISLVNIIHKRKRFLVSIIILLINTYGCFLTGSRAGLVTMVVVSVACILLPDKKRKAVGSLFGKVLLLLLFVCAGLFLARTLDSNIYDRLFTLEDYEDGSGRSLLWANAWKALTANPFSFFFGLGWGTTTIVGGGDVGIHNTFLSLLCDVGFLGTILFMTPIIIMSWRLTKQQVYLPVVLLVAQFIPAFFIDAINKRFFWNSIFLLGMYYYHYIAPPTKTIGGKSKYVRW